MQKASSCSQKDKNQLYQLNYVLYNVYNVDLGMTKKRDQKIISLKIYSENIDVYTCSNLKRLNICYCKYELFCVKENC